MAGKAASMMGTVGEATLGELAAAPARTSRSAAALRLHSIDEPVRTQAATSRRPRDVAARRTLVAADGLGFAFAWVLAWVLTGAVVEVSTIALVLTALPLWLLMQRLLGLYDRDGYLIQNSSLDELPKVAQSVVAGTGLLFLLGPLVSGVALARSEAIAFGLLAATLIPVARWMGRRATLRRVGPERLLVVGSGAVCQLFARKLSTQRDCGAVLVGYVDDWASDDASLPHLADTDGFATVCTDLQVDRIVVAFSALRHEDLLDIMRLSRRLGITISVVPRLFEMMGQDMEIEQVQGLTLLGLRSPTAKPSTLFLKRPLDVVVSSVLLLVLAPLMLLVAVAVRLGSPGPALFVQRRVGRGNRDFPMLKFRTMVVGADEMKPQLSDLNEAGDVMFKIADDPRITRVGRFLRRTSLDELPQLINVWLGHMSLVGPRPLVPAEDRHVLGWHRERLELTPGLTGPWQVFGRTNIPFAEMVNIDYLYVAEWSLWNDLKLLLRTIPVVFARTGH